MNTGGTPTKGTKHNGVAENIQLLLHFSLNIFFKLVSVLVYRRSIQVVGLGSLDNAIDLFAGIGNRRQGLFQISQLCLLPALNFQEPLKGLEFLLFGIWHTAPKIEGVKLGRRR